MAVKRRLAVAGNIFPALTFLVRKLSDLPKIRDALAEYDVGPSDFLALAFFGFGTVPLFELTHNLLLRKAYKKDCRESYSFLIVDHFAQASRIAILVCLADFLGVVLTAVDFPLFEGRDVDLGFCSARVLYTVWIANRIAAFKRFLLSLVVETRPEKLGKYKIYDRFLDAIIAVVTLMFVVDVLDADIGAGLTSVFAVGGLGTLVFTLASKDLATQIVSGIALSASDKFYEGDYVQLGDGTCGTVVKMTWLHTNIRGSDEIDVKIPNSTLANMRVSNLSRVDQCQVRQVLHFPYSDEAKMPLVCATIKEMIIDACPELITDGTRPFRAAWTDITNDRLEVTVDCRFQIKPLGDKFYENRMKVLEAISAACKKCEVEKALPTVLNKTVQVPLK